MRHLGLDVRGGRVRGVRTDKGAYGAEVVITPTSVPPDSPESYNGVAERLANGRRRKGVYPQVTQICTDYKRYPLI